MISLRHFSAFSQSPFRSSTPCRWSLTWCRWKIQKRTIWRCKMTLILGNFWEIGRCLHGQMCKWFRIQNALQGTRTCLQIFSTVLLQHVTVGSLISPVAISQNSSNTLKVILHQIATHLQSTCNSWSVWDNYALKDRKTVVVEILEEYQHVDWTSLGRFASAVVTMDYHFLRLIDLAWVVLVQKVISHAQTIHRQRQPFASKMMSIETKNVLSPTSSLLETIEQQYTTSKAIQTVSSMKRLSLFSQKMQIACQSFKPV